MSRPGVHRARSHIPAHGTAGAGSRASESPAGLKPRGSPRSPGPGPALPRLAWAQGPFSAEGSLARQQEPRRYLTCSHTNPTGSACPSGRWGLLCPPRTEPPVQGLQLSWPGAALTIAPLPRLRLAQGLHLPEGLSCASGAERCR